VQSVQVVGYQPGRPDEPGALEIAGNGEVTVQKLSPGSDLEYGLGNRHCAGAVSDGVHAACEEDDAPYCELHSSVWPCARCRGDCAMPLESCHEEHAIYLAGFEPATFKVGVTKSYRLERRLGEQGARRGAHIRTVENGQIARQIEAEMAEDIPDRITLPTKIDGLADSIDESAWETLLEPHDVKTHFEFEYGLDLEHRPIEGTILSGRVRGTRGRILVLGHSDTLYAVDLKALVGYELKTDAAAPDRQSSLQAF